MFKTTNWVSLILTVFLVNSCKKADDKTPKEDIQKPHRISKITLSPGKIITFTYDDNNQIVQSTISDSLKNGGTALSENTWDFIYDAKGNLDKVSGGSEDQLVDVTTNDSGYVTTATRVIQGSFVFGNDLKYDSSHRITEFRYELAGARNLFRYGYNSDGNLNSFERNGNAASNYNYSIYEFAFDSKKSIWTTDVNSNIAYWWLLVLTYSADQSPAFLLSYSNNVTQGNHIRVSGEQTPFTVSYTYDNEYPTDIKLIRTTDQSTFRGPYKIEY